MTGDLSRKFLLPALYRLERRHALDVPIVGVALGGLDATALVDRERVDLAAQLGALDPESLGRLANRLTFVAGDCEDPATFAALRRTLGKPGGLVHYLALPPSLFATAAAGIAAAGFNDGSRLLVEKPFGRNLASAVALNAELHRYFAEEAILRVDHLPFEEAVEQLLALRFVDSSLEPLWNRSHVASVQITLADDFGVEGRGALYDRVGAIRDALENHLLQLLTCFAMDRPAAGAADAVRDEQQRLLAAVRTASAVDLVLGQYDGYLRLPGVGPGSRTETYVAVRLFVDNSRWEAVPFIIRTGKALAATVVEVVVDLHRPETIPLSSWAGPSPVEDRLRIQLRPEAGLSCGRVMARAGRGVTPSDDRVRVELESTGNQVRDGYERVLVDALGGDARRFVREDMVEEEWRIVGELIECPGEPTVYRRGSWGPAEAQRLPAGGWAEISV